jgi:alpha-beta hydrolase superfamily lysophospholipase
MDASAKDPLGGFIQSSFQTTLGVELATYTWLPECGVEAAKGCVFVMHGVFAHARFEFLEPDEDNRRVLYEGSLPEALNRRDLIVIAHDHPSHGLSSGLRGYWESFDVIRDAAIEHFEASIARKDLCLAGKKTFLCGMSMGGTTSIEVCRARPDLFSGYVLFSPACRPPDDMFGLYGRFLQSVSGVLNTVAPRWRAMHLPMSEDDKIRDAVMKDDLVQKEGLRVRAGAEFMRVYTDIAENVESITFPDVLVFVAEQDNIVSPSGIKDFVAKVSCKGKKEIYICANTRHEVLREVGREHVHDKTVDWISEHAAH